MKRQGVRRTPVALCGLLALTCALGVTGGGAQAQDGPLGSAQARATALRAELADLRAQAAQAVSDYELAEAELSEAVVTSVGLSRDVDAARAVASEAAAQADRRVVLLYKNSGQNGLLVLLTRAGGAGDLVRRTVDLEAILDSDTQLREAAATARHDVEVAEQRASGVATERVRLSAQLTAERTRLDGLFEAQQERLDRADAEVLRIVEEQRAEARRQAVAALLAQERARVLAMARIGQLPGAAVVGAGSASSGPASSGPASSGPASSGPAYSGPDGTCPVGPVHNFTDTWHARRSGGRQHQGTDVFAAKGSNSYAVHDGVIDKVGAGGLGGITLWLRADNGDRFYYAHHDAQFVTAGQRVQAGQVLGHVGNSGNAEATPPHVHFEAHPGGGAAVNPYPWLAAVCAG